VTLQADQTACLKISNQRARLLGLYPGEGKQPAVNLNIGPAGNAEDNILTFVRPTKWAEDTGQAKLVGPVLDHSEFNGKKG
jgi:hypothetical protein